MQSTIHHTDEVPVMLFGKARVRIYPSPKELGEAAANHAAEVIRGAVRERGKARIVLATGNSQLNLIAALVKIPGIDWQAVEAFHLDDYVGLPKTHPSSFRYWIRTRVEEKVHPGIMHYMESDAADIPAEIERYSGLLNAGPLDLAFVGFGENGHIAFNDPAVADFHDPATIKVISPDEACRRQQAGEGHFASPEAVPRQCLTMTCPAIFRADAWICSVPDQRKAQAVRSALEGPITTACPASIVRTHANATVYLDTQSASLLTRRP
jgi:glucosamine-6-phosphate deaminase